MQSDADLTEILTHVRTIAVVGIKDREGEDAYRIPQYMQVHGYAIVPVNPKLERALGEPAYSTLGALSAAGIAVDLVNLFRAPDNVAAHVEEILAMSPRPGVVWMQLGIQHGPSATRLRAEGIRVVQDRCIMVDHRRLLASEAERADDASAG